MAYDGIYDSAEMEAAIRTQQKVIADLQAALAEVEHAHDEPSGDTEEV